VWVRFIYLFGLFIGAGRFGLLSQKVKIKSATGKGSNSASLVARTRKVSLTE
jgi:hypothetical protein